MLYTGTKVHNRGNPRVLVGWKASFYSSSDEDGSRLTGLSVSILDAHVRRRAAFDAARGSWESYSSKTPKEESSNPPNFLILPGPCPWHLIPSPLRALAIKAFWKPARACCDARTVVWSH